MLLTFNKFNKAINAMKFSPKRDHKMVRRLKIICLAFKRTINQAKMSNVRLHAMCSALSREALVFAVRFNAAPHVKDFKYNLIIAAAQLNLSSPEWLKEGKMKLTMRFEVL